MTDVDEFLNSSSFEQHPSFKFSNPGATISGTVVGKPRVVETDDMNGGRSAKLLVDLATDHGTFTVWITKGRMSTAVADAVKAAGGTLAEGGTLAIKHTELGEPSKPGLHPPKLWKAMYTPPPAGVNVDEVFGSEEPF